MNRYLVRGLAIWISGTILLRVLPAGVVAPERAVSAPFVAVLYAASFALFFLALGRSVAGARPAAEARGALIALVLPTLVLDAFSAAFFPVVFPNLPAGAAGVFGGWILICCAGCVAAALLPASRSAGQAR